MIAVLLLLVMLIPSPGHSEIYVAPFEGDGTALNPFRPLGQRTGPAVCQEIKRPDPLTLVDRWAVCESNVVPADPRVIALGSSWSNPITGLQLIKLRTSLNDATLVGAHVADVVGMAASRMGIVIKRRDGEGHVIFNGRELWKGLARDRPKRVASVSELLRAAWEWVVFPQSAWAASFSTGFDCADSSSLNCDGLTWTESGGGNWSIATNQARVTTTTIDRARMDSDLATDDQEVSMTITGINRGSATTHELVVLARFSTSASSYDWCLVRDDATQDQYAYGYTINTTITELGAVNTTAGAVTLKVRIDGDQHTCFADGVAVLGPNTTTNVTTHLRTGMFSRAVSGPANQAQVNQFQAMDYVAGAESFGVLRRRH